MDDRADDLITAAAAKQAEQDKIFVNKVCRASMKGSTPAQIGIAGGFGAVTGLLVNYLSKSKNKLRNAIIAGVATGGAIFTTEAVWKRHGSCDIM
jgi:hypothetical protein